MCKCLGIHHSVYYYHQNHQTNSYKIANQKLDVEIKKIYDESKGRYGSPKITKVLKVKGIIVSQKRVARRMKILCLRSITVKKFNHSGNSKTDNTKEYPNFLEQDFFADKPSKKWVGDITYIYTKETGWTYLAIVMDLFDLKVVGWSYGLNMTDDLVIDAFNKATINRKLNKDGIFHSDRGSQYTSKDFEKLLEDLGTQIKGALKNGINNYRFFNPNKQENSKMLELILAESTTPNILAIMEKEKNALGRYINATRGFEKLESGFYLNILSDEGDLYTYHVLISFPELYQFMLNLDKNYKVQKESFFEELDWDCYNNKPNIIQHLDKDIVENNGYQIVDFKVKGHIHVRTQKAEFVFVRWEESVDLIRFINNLISLLVEEPKVDWSIITRKFDALPVDEKEKKHIYKEFFRCFKFGKPEEIIHSILISAIENYPIHPTFDLEKQKGIIKRNKELGIRNRKFFTFLLENGIVEFSERLLFKNHE